MEAGAVAAQAIEGRETELQVLADDGTLVVADTALCEGIAVCLFLRPHALRDLEPLPGRVGSGDSERTEQKACNSIARRSCSGGIEGRPISE